MNNVLTIVVLIRIEHVSLFGKARKDESSSSVSNTLYCSP